MTYWVYKCKMSSSNIRRCATKMFTRSISATSLKKKTIWTPERIVQSPFPRIDVPNVTLVEQVWKKLDQWADKTAVVCAITNRSYTYHQLYKKSRNFAVRLRTHFQIVDNDVVCNMMSNSPEYCTAVLGILQAGAVTTTMNPTYTSYEVQKQLILSDPKVLIVSTASIDIVKAGLKLANKNIPIIVVKQTRDDQLPNGTVSFEELTDGDNIDYSVLQEVKTTSDDVALLPYSSGTTGFPKGVELTNYNVVANLVQSDSEGVQFIQETTSNHQDVVLCALPFYHIYGLSVIMLHKLSAGAKLVTLPKFQPNTYLSSIRDHKVSLLCAVPPMVLFLGSYPESTKDHLQYITRITCGAAPTSIHDIHRLLEKLQPNASFTQLYGLTETSPLATTEVRGSTDYESSGYPLPNTELKIVGSDSQTLGPGEIGELFIRGPQIMKGYRNNEEATKNAITEDGWFKSGDLAAISDHGALYIKDRLKELIKVKGHQVPPAELESLLKEHPAVDDAAVLGIPDRKMGEVPKAFIVLKQGCNISDKQIIDFVKERVTEYKWIRDVTFIDSVPRNPSGKILKRILKEKYDN